MTCRGSIRVFASVLFSLSLMQSSLASDLNPALIPDRVVFETADGEVDGYALKNDAKSGHVVLLSEEGLIVLPLEAILRVLSRTKGRLEEVPGAALGEAMGHEDPWVRDHCQQILYAREGRLPREVVDGLVSTDPDVVRRVLQVMVRRPQPGLASQFRRLMKHDDELLRAMALDAYSVALPEEATDACLDLIQRERSPWVLHSAYRALGESGTLTAVEPLLGQLPGATKPNRVTIFRALRKLTGEDFGASEKYWVGWWTVYGRKLLEEDGRGDAESR